MVDENTARAALAEQMLDVLAYRGTDMFAQFVLLLGCIDECYREEMLTVTPDRLLYKQGAAAQVRALRNQLINSRTDSISDLPKV